MIIIDASVALKFINTQEEGSEKTLELLERHTNGEEEIIIPSLLFLEVANALATKSSVLEAQIKEGIDTLYDSKFFVYDVQKDDTEEAALLARKYNTSVYDMIYALIAKKKNITLITADSKFINRVKFPFVRSLN